MKYLVLFGVLFVAYLVWRAQRRAGRPAAPAPAAAAAALPQDMVRCPVCAVHLPRGDALADARGRLYCSPEHRLRDAGGS